MHVRVKSLALAVVRVLLGAYWLKVALPKFADPRWRSGAAALAMWQAGLDGGHSGHPAMSLGWYRAFITFLIAHHLQAPMAQLVMAGELAVGVCLVLGLLTPTAAAVAAFLNLNYMLAGSAGTNPILYTAAWVILLQWQSAALYGLDRWFLLAPAPGPSHPMPEATASD